MFATEPAILKYHKWSDQAITFDKEDHPRHIPNPGAYPLVVDPVIGNTRLTKSSWTEVAVLTSSMKNKDSVSHWNRRLW